MTAPTPRSIADLDVSVEVLVAAMETTNSESDRIAYSLDRELLAHPEVCSTDADYPGWVPGLRAVPTVRCTCARSWGLHSKDCAKYVPGHEFASYDGGESR